MKRPLLILSLPLIVLAFVLATLFSTPRAAATSGASYTVAGSPFRGKLPARTPAMVKSVTSSVTDGFEISKVRVQNLSKTQSIKAITLRWFLTNPSLSKQALASGETPLFAIPGTLSPGRYFDLQYPVTSMAAAYNSDPSQKGNFRFTVMIGQVQFNNGQFYAPEVQQRFLTFCEIDPFEDDCDGGDDVDGGGGKGGGGGQGGEQKPPCPKQECKFVEATATEAAHYTCIDVISRQECQNNTTSCTNSLCD